MQTRNPLFTITEVKAVPATEAAAIPQMTVEAVDNHVYFYADVNSDRCLALIRAIREVDVRLRNEHLSRHMTSGFPQTPIWLHIQSYGGDLFAGLAMIDQLAGVPSPVYSVIEGVAASAATLMSMACQRRYILPNSFMLIHQLRALIWGTHEQIKDEAKLSDMLMDKVISFYSDKTKLDAEAIRALLQRETWMDAATCLERGFVDEVIA